jgi:hypothetical protein
MGSEVERREVSTLSARMSFRISEAPGKIMEISFSEVRVGI